MQNAVVVGGGHVGQLIARKYLLHPEYGIRLVGVVDDQPLEQRDELAGVELWRTDELLELVQERDRSTASSSPSRTTPTNARSSSSEACGS